MICRNERGLLPLDRYFDVGPFMLFFHSHCSTKLTIISLRLIVLAALFCVWVWSGKAAAEWITDTQGIMGTQVSVTLWHENIETGREAVAAVMADMRRIDETLSPYKSESSLAKLNENAYKTKQVLTDELTLLIDKSLYFSKLSHGAFDITFASLGWYYDYRNHKKPSAEQTKELLPAINYRYLDFNKVQKTLVYTHKNVRIDLGGVAKGYAVDRAIAILQRFGVKHASVSAGGDSRLLGDRLGRPWLIGIKNPRLGNDDDEAVIRLPLSNVAISTSGDYERYFIDEQTGEHVHHIINPKTGDSARDVVSVTILGDEGLNTDPMSTTVFVLGVKEGLALVNQLPGFDCVIIDRFGAVHYSKGLMPAK